MIFFFYFFFISGLSFLIPIKKLLNAQNYSIPITFNKKTLFLPLSLSIIEISFIQYSDFCENNKKECKSLKNIQIIKKKSEEFGFLNGKETKINIKNQTFPILITYNDTVPIVGLISINIFNKKYKIGKINIENNDMILYKKNKKGIKWLGDSINSMGLSYFNGSKTNFIHIEKQINVKWTLSSNKIFLPSFIIEKIVYFTNNFTMGNCEFINNNWKCSNLKLSHFKSFVLVFDFKNGSSLLKIKAENLFKNCKQKKIKSFNCTFMISKAENNIIIIGKPGFEKNNIVFKLNEEKFGILNNKTKKNTPIKIEKNKNLWIILIYIIFSILIGYFFVRKFKKKKIQKYLQIKNKRQEIKSDDFDVREIVKDFEKI